MNIWTSSKKINHSVFEKLEEKPYFSRNGFELEYNFDCRQLPTRIAPRQLIQQLTGLNHQLEFIIRL